MRSSQPARSRRSSPSFRRIDRKSTRLNSSHQIISYAVFCLKKKKKKHKTEKHARNQIQDMTEEKRRPPEERDMCSLDPNWHTPIVTVDESQNTQRPQQNTVA